MLYETLVSGIVVARAYLIGKLKSGECRLYSKKKEEGYGSGEGI
jgi:hypothetical protein